MGSLDLEKALQAIADPLAQEIKKLKQSYFSKKGKPNAGWAPLQEETVDKKYAAKYAEPESFNYATGQLKDSCQVNVTQDGLALNIAVKFDENRFCDYLTEKLGRDFVTFTVDEKKAISKLACQLLIKELSK